MGCIRTFSKGGHAALATAQRASEVQSDFPLVATVALAPGSDVSLITDIDFASIKELTGSGQAPLAWGVAGNLNGYGSFLLHGATAIAPNLDLNKYVGDDLKPLLSSRRMIAIVNSFHRARHENHELGCRRSKAHLISKGSRPIGTPIPKSKPYCHRTEVGKVKLSVPVFMAHGDADIDVPIGSDAPVGNDHASNRNQC